MFTKSSSPSCLSEFPARPAPCRHPWAELTVRIPRLLESFLEEIGVSQEEFAAECDKAMAKGGDSAFVYHQIMAVEDFVSFKRVRRNPASDCFEDGDDEHVDEGGDEDDDGDGADFDRLDMSILILSYGQFTQMMVKRNRELELELLRELQQQQQQAGVDMGDAANTTGNTSISSAVMPAPSHAESSFASDARAPQGLQL
jgi:hypothetical protein